MRAKRLTAQQALELWKKFYAAYGPEQMKASYGEEDPPTKIKENRRVWAFSDGDDVIGWGSSQIDLNDAEDEEAYLFVGVFPQFQGRGYHMKIVDWMAAKAKRDGAKWASMAVLKSNTAHYQRTLKHAENGPWVFAGEFWFPHPGEGYFLLPLNDEAKAMRVTYVEKQQV